MRKSEWMKSATIVVGLFLAAFAGYAQQSSSQQSSSQQTGDPVADAARKAREEKKNAQKPKKVFTDDDVKAANPSGEKPSVQNADATQGTKSGTESASTATAKGLQKGEGEEKENPNS